MPAYLNLATGTLLLFLVLMFASLTSNLLLKLLSARLTRGPLGDWLTDNETSVMVTIWALVALATYFIGPRLLLILTTDIGLLAR